LAKLITAENTGKAESGRHFDSQLRWPERILAPV